MNKSSFLDNSGLVPEDKVLVRGEANCNLCQKKFRSGVRREHKCKRCFRSVCSKCADKRKPVKITNIFSN